MGVEAHKTHVLQIFTLVYNHKLFANLKKVKFAESETPLLGYIVGKYGERPDRITNQDGHRATCAS